MPRAERRRLIELHLLRHSKTPMVLSKAQTKDRKKTKYRKSASFEDDEVGPFPLYKSQSHDYLLEEDQPLLGSHQNLYYENNGSNSASENSAHLGWEDNIVDNMEKASSITLLSGARRWSSTWPSKTMMEIMDAVNVQLEDFNPPTENNNTHQVPSSLSAEDKLGSTRTPSNEPRNIIPAHKKLAIDTVRKTAGLPPQCAAHVLRNAFRYGSNCRLSLSTEPAALFALLLPEYSPTYADQTPTLTPAYQESKKSSGPHKNRALQFYQLSNAKFEQMGNSWIAWHKRVEDIKVNLISIRNMRDTLIDGVQMLLAVKKEVDHNHRNWQPTAIPIESVRAQTATHYVVETTFNEETKLKELPKVTKVSMSRDRKVLRQVEKQNADYKMFEENFEKVMMPLRYAQVRFRNLQLKLEEALALEVLLMREALGLHEGLEVQLIEGILGEAFSPMPRALSNEQRACFRSAFEPLPLSSPASTEYDSALPTHSRSSRSSSFDNTNSIHSVGERKSIGTTISSLDDVFAKGLSASDWLPIMRRKFSITAEVIKDMSEDIEDAIEAIAKAKRSHNFWVCGICECEGNSDIFC